MDPRAEALERLKAKRRLSRNAVIFVVLIGFFVAIWALTGAGYFWPIWPALGLGIVVAIDAWTVFGQRPITEADIEREMNRDTRPKP